MDGGLAARLRGALRGATRWPAASRPGLLPRCLPRRHSQANPGTMRHIRRRWLVLSRPRSWSLSPPVQPCLPQDASLGTRWQFGAQLASYCHPSAFQRVLVLSMASHGCDQVPTVSLNQLDYFTDLQGHRSLHLVLPRCPETQSRGRAACCWHATGSLRQRNLLKQARPCPGSPASVVLPQRPTVKMCQNSPRKIDVVPRGRSEIRIKPLTSGDGRI